MTYCFVIQMEGRNMRGYAWDDVHIIDIHLGLSAQREIWGWRCMRDMLWL